MILWDHLYPKYFLTPFAITKIRKIRRETFSEFHTGFMDIWIFGIRIARIQQTNPW